MQEPNSWEHIPCLQLEQCLLLALLQRVQETDSWEHILFDCLPEFGQKNSWTFEKELKSFMFRFGAPSYLILTFLRLKVCLLIKT